MSIIALPIFLLYIFLVYISFSTEGTEGGVWAKYYFLTLILSGGLFLLSKNKNWYYLIWSLIVVFIISTYNFFVSGYDFHHSIIVLICFLSAYFGFTFLTNYEVLSKFVIRIFIVINVAFLVFQIFYFLLYKEALYIHSYIFTFSRESYHLELLAGVMRFTGYHLEPGSYANVMALVLMLYYYLNKRADAYFMVGHISLVATLSTIGGLFFFFYLFIYLYEKKVSLKNFILLFSFFPTIVFLVIQLGFIDLALGRFSHGLSGDSSSLYKISNLYNYLNSTSFEVIFGRGIENVDTGCSNCGYVNSNGAMFYSFYTLGLFGGLFFLFLLIISYVKKGWVILPMSLVLVFSRYPLNYIMFWLSIILLLSFKVDSKSKHY